MPGEQHKMIHHLNWFAAARMQTTYAEKSNYHCQGGRMSVKLKGVDGGGSLMCLIQHN